MAQILFWHLVRSIMLLCLIFGICIGEANAVKTGVGIFDTLFISANASLSMNGDVYLLNAHVLGEGRLIIHEESQSKIVSHNSEVNCLDIITKGEVNLEGTLLINQSLTVQSGIFDVTSGALIFSDSTKIRLLTGAEIRFKSELCSLPGGNGLLYQIDFSAKAILVACLILEENTMWKIQRQNLEPTRFEMPIYKDVESAPPEGCRAIPDHFYQKNIKF